MGGRLGPGKSSSLGRIHGVSTSGRAKSARVINYEEFKKALEELSAKRFKGKSKEEAFDAICQLVAGKEPANVGVTVSALLVLGWPRRWAICGASWLGESWEGLVSYPRELSPTESQNRGCCGAADRHQQVHGLPQGALR